MDMAEIIDLDGNKINVSTELEIRWEGSIQHEMETFNNEKSFKDALIANLYSTVDFLKSEMVEKKLIIKSLLEKINNNTPDIPHIETSSCNKNVIAQTSPNFEDNKSIPINNDFHLNTHESSTIYETSLCNSANLFNKQDNYDADSDDSNDINRNNGFIDVDIYNDSDNYLRFNNHATKKRYIKHKRSNNSNKTASINNEQNKVKTFNHMESYADEKWPKNTVLIMSDSMMNQLEGPRLSKDFNVKVKAIGGCTIERMFSEINPMLQKEPDNIILNVGTNDSQRKSADQIVNELIKLKRYIENILSKCVVILSKPMMRTDIPNANLTIRYVNSKLNNLGILLLDNDNICEHHLGKKGHHLNKHGTSRLGLNIISLLRQL